MRSFTILCLVLIVAVCVTAAPFENREKRSPNDDHDNGDEHHKHTEHTELDNANGRVNENADKGPTQANGGKRKRGRGRKQKGIPEQKDDQFIGESPFALITDGFME